MSGSSANKQVLYLSYDGMTDPLGQSQVLPYIIGLSKLGYQFTLLSAEKPDRLEKFGDVIRKITSENSIDWHTIPFTRKPPFISKIRDLKNLKKTASRLHQQKGFDLVHCRSYVSADAGLMLNKKHGIPFLFDMRGFWVDERVDGGLWNLSNPVYKYAYNSYKKKELNYLNHAAHIISLTEAGKKDLHTWKNVKDLDITVIPCSADFELFPLQDKDAGMEIRKELGISRDQIVLNYLGSIGTWYMLDEMLDYFAEFQKSYPNSIFFFITNEPEDYILGKAQEKGISVDNIRVRFAQRQEVNRFLSAVDLSIFFIKPCYSKISSSPTKLGELHAMGIPVITNSGIGDVDEIVENGNNGWVINKFSPRDYQEAIRHTDQLMQLDRYAIRDQAFQYYNLQSAVEKYGQVYGKIFQGHE